MRTVSLILAIFPVLFLLACTEPETAPTEVNAPAVLAVPTVPTIASADPSVPAQAATPATSAANRAQPGAPPQLVSASPPGIQPSGPAAIPVPAAGASPMPAPMPTPTEPAVVAAPAPTPEPTATPAPTPTATPTPPPTADTLPWVQDGLDGLLEQRALAILRELETGAPAVFLSVARAEHQLLPPESDRAIRALEALASLALANEQATARLAAMPFLYEVEYNDLEAMLYLQEAADIHPGYLDTLVPFEGQGTPITDELAGEIPVKYLEIFLPDAGSRIRSLPWVDDGIAYVPESEESTPAGRKLALERRKMLILVDTAQAMPAVFDGLVGKQWMQRHYDGVELVVMENIIELAQLDRALALKLLAMPFLDTYQNPDAWALRFILELRSTEPWQLDRLLADRELAGGITDEIRDRLTSIYKERYLESPTASRVREVTGLNPDTFPGWVTEPGNRHEEAAGEQLLEIWSNHPAIAEELVERPWAAPELTTTGRRQMAYFHEIVVSSDQVAERLAYLWETQGYSETFLLSLHRLTVKNPQAALLFLDLDWARGNGHSGVPQGLGRVITKDREGTDLVERVLGMRWVVDGLNWEEENEAARLLAAIWEEDQGQDLARRVLELDWVNDGASEEDNAALLAIYVIIRTDPERTGPYQEQLERVFELGGSIGIEGLWELIYASETYVG